VNSFSLAQPARPRNRGYIEWHPCETSSIDLINQPLSPSKLEAKTSHITRKSRITRLYIGGISPIFSFTEENKIECRRGKKKVTCLRAQTF